MKKLTMRELDKQRKEDEAKHRRWSPDRCFYEIVKARHDELAWVLKKDKVIT